MKGLLKQKESPY